MLHRRSEGFLYILNPNCQKKFGRHEVGKLRLGACIKPSAQVSRFPIHIGLVKLRHLAHGLDTKQMVSVEIWVQYPNGIAVAENRNGVGA